MISRNKIEFRHNARHRGNEETPTPGLFSVPLPWRQVWWEHGNELGQIVVRLAFALLIGIYVVNAGLKWGFASPQVFAPAIVYAIAALIAFGHLAHLLVTRRTSLVRIAVGIVIDIASLSLFLYFGDAVTAPFFPVYLWLTLANGFRFGEIVLISTAGLSVVSFAAVTLTTPFWIANSELAIGLLVALIALPTYVFRLLKSLNEARAEAETANEAKSRFLAVISHEFRTPLNAIIGLSDVLRVSQLSVDQKQMIRSVGVSANSLMDLMDDLLEFSRLDAGNVEHEPQPFDLFELLAEIEAILAPQANQKGLTFYLRILNRVPRQIVGDKKYFREVLLNLAANAIKYTDAGDVCIDVSGESHNSGQEGDSVHLRIDVCDTGMGIAAEQHERIFQSFTQTDQARNSARGGVGLGLAICKRLTETMGGEIFLRSTLGEGSTFTVRIPFAVEAGDNRGHPTPDTNQNLLCLGNAADLPEPFRAALDRYTNAVWVQDLAALTDEAASQIQRGIARPVIAISADHGRQIGASEAGETSETNETSEASEWGRQIEAAKRKLSDLPIVLWLHPGDGSEDYSAALSCKAIDMFVDVTSEQDLASALAYATARTTDPLSDDKETSSDAPLEILVAEDNRVNRTVASRILRSLGHKVDLVENGQQALEAMGSMRYDIVFMDINMPIIDGLEATKMRRIEEMGGERIPIIALTADATPEALENCEAAGMDGITHKPVSAASLQGAIDQLISEQPHILKSHELIMDEKAMIATHPRFQEALPNILDLDKIAELHALDDSGEFLETVAHEFVEDALQLVADIGVAIEAVDLSGFRDLNHALRSCAANVGAIRIFSTCKSMAGCSRSELAEQGAKFTEDLQAALRVTAIELERFSENAPESDVAVI